MIVDAMLKSTADEKASAIYHPRALLDSILGPLALAVIQLLVLAAKIWTCSNIPKESPTREWLYQYLTVTLESGIYDAYEKKDLIWAIYNYFTWKKPENSQWSC